MYLTSAELLVSSDPEKTFSVLRLLIQLHESLGRLLTLTCGCELSGLLIDIHFVLVMLTFEL